IRNRQFLAVNDALTAHGNVCVHGLPAVGAELFYRQHLVCRLYGFGTPGFLLGIGVGANEWAQVAEQQLIGDQLSRELWSWLAGDIGEVAMNIALTDAAAEVLIAVGGTLFSLKLRAEAAVG